MKDATLALWLQKRDELIKNNPTERAAIVGKLTIPHIKAL